MSDEHDFAQDLAAREREYLIGRRRPVEAAVTMGGDCEDCGGEIPAARRKARPGATRCVTCQALHEVRR